MRMVDYFQTVFRCFSSALSGERRIFGICALMFIVSLLFGSLMGPISVFAHRAMSAQEAPRNITPTWTAKATTRAMEYFMAKEREDRPLPLKGAQVMVVSSDPTQKATGEKLVEFAGGRVVPSSGQAHVEILWDAQQEEWIVSSLRPDASELAVFTWFGLRRSATAFQHGQGLELPDPNVAVIMSGGQEPKGEDVNPRAILSVLVIFCVVFPSLSLMFAVTGLLSIDLDRERAAGSLESFALVVRPLSGMFLGRALARSVLPAVMFVAAVCVAGLFVGFPSFLTLLMLTVGMCLAGVSLGMLGQLQVVWYHHMYSRFVGMLIFNPMFVMMIFLFFAGGHLLRLVMDVGRAAAASGGRLPIVEWPAIQVWPVFVAALVTTCIVTALCCLMIEWRLGARRQGLSRVI